jgi:hypothetical protein
MTRALQALLLAIALVCTCQLTHAQGGNVGSNSSPASNNLGRPLPGIDVSICQPLATTAANVTSNLAVLTMASNPITAGFAAGMQIQVAGFTGGDTYFNAGSIVNGQITSGFTILSVTATTITYSLTHANATASSNGNVLQEGNSTTSCGGLSTITSDPALMVPITQPLITDALGNWNAYAAAGVYYGQFYGAGVTTILKQYAIGCVPSSSTSTCGAALNGTNAWTGTDSFCNSNNKFFAGTSCYPTLQSALNAADPGSINCALTTTCGMMVIPPKYAGTDTYNNVGLNVLVVDQRSSIFNAPSMNVPTFITSIDSDGTYPAGRDINIFPGGPAGFFLRRSTVDTTTTASLSVGANTNVLVGAVNNHNVDLGNVQAGTLLTLFAIGTAIAPQKIFVGRETANNEQLAYNATVNCPTSGTWNIVDGTHLCMNTTKTHTGTTDIEQPPDPVRFDFTDLQLRSYQARPSQDGTTCLPMFWGDTNGLNEMTFPSDTTCAAPRNLPSFQTGFNILTAPTFSGSPTPTSWQAFVIGGPNSSLTNIDQTGALRGFVGPFYGATSNNGSFGVIRLQNGTFITERNLANGDDACISLDANDMWYLRKSCNGTPGPTFTVSFPSATGIALVTGNGATPIQTKHGVAGCATGAAAGSTCTTTVTWNSSFADTSYTPVCGGELVTSGVPVNGGIASKANGSVTFTTVAGTAAAAQYTGVNCNAVHD